MTTAAGKLSRAYRGNVAWRCLSDVPPPARPWTRAEDNDISLAIEAGVDPAQLAGEIGRPVDQVIQRAAQLLSEGAA